MEAATAFPSGLPSFGAANCIVPSTSQDVTLESEVVRDITHPALALTSN